MGAYANDNDFKRILEPDTWYPVAGGGDDGGNTKTDLIGNCLGDIKIESNGIWSGTWEIQTKLLAEDNWETVYRVKSDYDQNFKFELYNGDLTREYRSVATLLHSKSGSVLESDKTWFEVKYDKDSAAKLVGDLPAGAPYGKLDEIQKTENVLPSCITYANQRICMMVGSKLYVSSIKDLTDFTSYGALSSDKGYILEIADLAGDSVYWITKFGDDLYVGGIGGIWRIGQYSSLETVSIRIQSHLGVQKCKPIRFANKLIYVSCNGKVMSSSFDYASEDIISLNLSLLYPGLIASEIVTFIPYEKDNIIIMQTTDEKQFWLKYDPSNEIIAISTSDYQKGLCIDVSGSLRIFRDELGEYIYGEEGFEDMNFSKCYDGSPLFDDITKRRIAFLDYSGGFLVKGVFEIGEPYSSSGGANHYAEESSGYFETNSLSSITKYGSNYSERLKINEVSIDGIGLGITKITAGSDAERLVLFKDPDVVQVYNSEAMQIINDGYYTTSVRGGFKRGAGIRVDFSSFRKTQLYAMIYGVQKVTVK